MLALLHLVVPLALRSIATRGRPRRLAPIVRRRTTDAYVVVTIVLGVLALVLSGQPLSVPGPPWLGATVLLAAVLLGAGLPLLTAFLSGRPRRFSRLPRRFLDTVACAAAEEVLWRLSAIGALVGSGLPASLAAALSLAGFVLLHVPRSGWRGVHYLTVLGAVLTALALWGGVLAAVACHSVHNLVMAATTRRHPVAVASVDLPPTTSW
jgi:MFS family permease